MARTIIIKYEHFICSTAHMSKKFWSAYFEDTGEAYDYDTKKSLIEKVTKDGYAYKIMRHCRNGYWFVAAQG